VLDGQRHTPATLPPGKSPATYFIGSLVGLWVGPEGWTKSLPPEFEPELLGPYRFTVPSTISGHHKYEVTSRIQRALKK